MRLFTVRVDDDPQSERALVVLAIREDGALLLTEPDNDDRLRWVPAEWCRLSTFHRTQDEREWWRGITDGHG